MIPPVTVARCGSEALVLSTSSASIAPSSARTFGLRISAAARSIAAIPAAVSVCNAGGTFRFAVGGYGSRNARPECSLDDASDPETCNHSREGKGEQLEEVSAGDGTQEHLGWNKEQAGDPSDAAHMSGEGIAGVAASLVERAREEGLALLREDPDVAVAEGTECVPVLEMQGQRPDQGTHPREAQEESDEDGQERANGWRHAVQA